MQRPCGWKSCGGSGWSDNGGYGSHHSMYMATSSAPTMHTVVDMMMRFVQANPGQIDQLLEGAFGLRLPAESILHLAAVPYETKQEFFHSLLKALVRPSAKGPALLAQTKISEIMDDVQQTLNPRPTQVPSTYLSNLGRKATTGRSIRDMMSQRLETRSDSEDDEEVDRIIEEVTRRVGATRRDRDVTDDIIEAVKTSLGVPSTSRHDSRTSAYEKHTSAFNSRSLPSSRTRTEQQLMGELTGEIIESGPTGTRRVDFSTPIISENLPTMDPDHLSQIFEKIRGLGAALPEM